MTEGGKGGWSARKMSGTGNERRGKMERKKKMERTNKENGAWHVSKRKKPQAAHPQKR